MQNSHLNWLELNTNDIVSKIDANGVRYLELFLQDYTKLFNKKVNPSCSKCINNYLQEYKEKFMIMENKSNYILHKKREGLPLEFGSKIRVNNANITNEYAQKLIKKYMPIHGENTLNYLFQKYPTVNEKVKESTELSLSELRKKYPEISARSREDFLQKIPS